MKAEELQPRQHASAGEGSTKNVGSIASSSTPTFLGNNQRFGWSLIFIALLGLFVIDFSPRWVRLVGIIVLVVALILAVWKLKGAFESDPQRLNKKQRRAWLVVLLSSAATGLCAFLGLYPIHATQQPLNVSSARWWIRTLERNQCLQNTRAAINSIFVLRGTRHMWVAGTDGIILHSANGGKTWHAQDSGTNASLNAIHFSDPLHGTAIGDRNTLLVTADGGKHWGSPLKITTLQAPHSPRGPIPGPSWDDLGNDFVDLSFGSSQHGLIIRKNGAVLHTTDAGITWKESDVSREIKSSARPAPLCSVIFTSPNSASIATRAGAVIHISRSGDDWTTNGVHRLSQEIVKLAVLDRTNLFTLSRHPGNPGSFRLSSLSTGNYMDFHNTTPITDIATDLHQRGWVANSAGFVMPFVLSAFATPDSPAPGLRFPNGEPSRRHTLGWAGGSQFVGAGGLKIFGTKDDQSWHSLPLPPRSYPPPLFWALAVACIASALVLVVLFRPERMQKIVEPDYAVSDAAVASLKDDKLDFGSVARSLARFIRNPNTVPPLTFAVTGDWGSGKSSILNMVCADLAGRAFPVVRFNAWHHQNEEQLFPVLLKNVVDQGVPSIWGGSGLAFRARLYGQRIKKHRIRAALWGLGLVVLSLPLVNYLRRDLSEAARANDPSTNAAAPVQLVIKPLNTTATNNLTELLRDGVQADWQQPPKQPKPESTVLDWVTGILTGRGSWPQWVTWLLLSLVALSQFINRLKAFGLDPLSMVAKAREGTKLANLDAKASFQLKFAEQFKEVTDAMDLRQLTIFIDDLDRCYPDKVAQMLEAINFLIASGKCFVVLGFSRPQVEAAVGLGFSALAAEMDLAGEQWRNEFEQRAKDNGQSPPKPEDAVLQRENRRLFARLYLKKLINLEIAVPKPSDIKLVDMLTNAVPSPRAMHPDMPAETASHKDSVTTLASLLLLAWTLVVPSIQAEEPPNKGQNSIAQQGPPGYQTEVLQIKLEPVQLSSSTPPPSYHWWWAFLPGALVIGLCVHALRQRAVEEALDPPELRKALNIWLPWVRPHFPSPRELKRFFNLVRYVVTRSSADIRDTTIPQKHTEATLKAEDVVYLSAQTIPSLNNPLPDKMLWEQLRDSHRKTFGREPDDKAHALFTWLTRDLPLK